MTSRRPPSPRPRIEGADRLRRLLEAQRTITDDLSLPTMLDRIVQAGCDLVGAKYGALAVIAPDGSIERLVHHGIDAETVAQIKLLPRVGGLFGDVIDRTGPLRMGDLPTDPRGHEVPALLPPMRSVIGVPIRVHGGAYGELYVTDPVAHRFDVDDEEVVVALAGIAGTAIENARLFDEAHRSRDWLNASGEIARVLLADADEEVLFEVVSRALSIAEADYAALILPIENNQLRVAVAKGLGAERFLGTEFDPNDSTFGKAILAAESIRTHDMTLWADVGYENEYDFGPAMIAPLVDAQGSRGAVLLIRTARRLPFTRHDVELASTFAAQVALALQLNDARADAEWVRVLEDRHRIAQDLHDNVMQRLFATGMGLQALAEQRLEPEVADRLRRYITDLDETIDQIRNRVFGLRDDAVSGVRRRRGAFPHVARSAAVAVGAGAAALRSLSPRARRPDAHGE
jgi:GAF domain-containing protein